ncbi:hypothetical protein FNF31_05681 [Cafeteria roenbergensis]|uniref:Uncharacterized protein n=1 Tax=Cafeteria roenbergensis TaxID=33653 RepID=A0A5A8DLG4_CAFRO|nr:hypothetical protein FNF31_05681 [Cafeteria roenbergensis]KAA0164661.1 hypothetical protein FNF28_03722 [Cafeteria roenbergensis]
MSDAAPAASLGGFVRRKRKAANKNVRKRVRDDDVEAAPAAQAEGGADSSHDAAGAEEAAEHRTAGAEPVSALALLRKRAGKRARRGLEVDESGSGALIGRHGKALVGAPAGDEELAVGGAGRAAGIGTMTTADGKAPPAGAGSGAAEFTQGVDGLGVGGSSSGQEQGGVEAALRLKQRQYVEEQLRARGLAAPDSATPGHGGSAAADVALTVEEEELAGKAPLPSRAGDSLYALPDDVQRAFARGKAEGVTKPVSDKDARRLGIDGATLKAAQERWAAARRGDLDAAAAEEDPTQGGMIAWSTGLAEVALPVEVKLANVRATEEAKRAFLERAAARAREREHQPADGVGIGDVAAGSFNASFSTHRRAAASQSRIKSKRMFAYGIKDQLDRAKAVGDEDAVARLSAELRSATEELERVQAEGAMRLTADVATAQTHERNKLLPENADDVRHHPAAGRGHGHLRTRATDDELARRYRRSIIRRF